MTKTPKLIEKSVQINASREAIWDALITKETFEDWCSAFHPGSTYEGDWSEGSEMRFLGPNEDGTVSGMASKVVSHTPNHHIECRHYGVILKGELKTEGEDADGWTDLKEEYTLTGDSAPYTLNVETEVPESFYDMFMECWANALARLKEIAESK